MDEMEKRIQLWQERLAKNQSAYARELSAMDKRQDLYSGGRSITAKNGAARTEGAEPASMVRNIVSELVEAQVDSSIPMPKVTARTQEDENLAKVIEDYLRNEIDRLPFEQINDLDERITPVQGGDYFLVEWDAERHTRTSRGELSVKLLHPKQVIPQDGVSEIEDMDFIIVRMAMTKLHVKEKYGKDVSDEGEAAPESRGSSSAADDVVTVNFGYFRNEAGGIGRYVWVNDIELEYLQDYQARMLKHCKKCGETMENKICPACGSKAYEQKVESTFTLQNDKVKADGNTIPAYKEKYDAMPFAFDVQPQRQEFFITPNQIPYYKPDCYPIVVRKNVSSWGRVLGDSDTDKIQDQQNAIKKCDTRVQEKLDKGGSILTKHIESKMEMTDSQLKLVEVNNPSEVSCLHVMNLQVDASGDMAVAEQNYQSARNILGITDSFQGRQDRTATSGTAKQIAVAQSAGRLESKRIMKNAMYANLYKVMFKFLLAYSDEPRTIRRDKLNGSTEYGVFDRIDFLAEDAAGEYYWKDDFLFSVDTSSALASNREAMWQEVRQNFEQGVFGHPANIQTLLLFWRMMAKLHYPMAEEIRTQLEEQQQDIIQSQQIQPSQQEMPSQSFMPPELMGMLEEQMPAQNMSPMPQDMM